MPEKNCCIEGCTSCTTREEDIGVTYHKFPKVPTLREIWSNVTRHPLNPELIEYVCSRHFCKSDFQTYKDSKYILKSDAVPSIFSWTMTEKSEESDKMDTETDIEETEAENKNETLNSSKELEGENVDAIKKFIEEQTLQIAESKAASNEPEIKETVTEATEITKELNTPDTKEPNNPNTKEQNNAVTKEPNNPDTKEPNNPDTKEPSNPVTQEPNNPVNENVEQSEQNVTEQKNSEEPLAVATSVMDMILSETEFTQSQHAKSLPKSPGKLRCIGAEKGKSMALSEGSKVEAKDFAEIWHPAEIIEVDYDEMEVLLHYDDVVKKHDEWVSVSSPRLRPRCSKPQSPAPLPSTSTAATSQVTVKEEKEIKVEKPEERQKKLVFAVGERCLARWRDNRRFIATVSQDLGDSKYEILFDDGVKWTCNVARLSKLKESKNLTVDTTGLPSTSSIVSPIYGSGPSIDTPQIMTPVAPVPTPNTHLFDPTRDYLGSKSERREMKRKLNIKEIFNIGQKKKKIEEKVAQPKSKPKPKVINKKPKVVVKKLKIESQSEVKTEGPAPIKTEDQGQIKTESVQAVVKQEIPDAVASIIGTVSKEPAVEESGIKTEEAVVKEEEIKEEDINVDVVDPDNCKMDLDDLANSETLSAPESQDMKHGDDPALQEEVKLEKFDKDETNHDEVIGRMKEVINKLEDGINQVEMKVEKMEVDQSKPESKTTENDAPKDPKEKRVKSKIKKVKKVRMLQEKKVKKQVEKVKTELENMKKQMEEMRRQMSEELAKKQSSEMPESFLLPGEWCCKWVNGQPVGTVSEIEFSGKLDASGKPALPRRSVQVEDKRLPAGWTKHMVRRSVGNSAGKWDVVLMSPDNRRFHTKTDMRQFFEQNPSIHESLMEYEYALCDFGVHLKLSRRMGWYSTTPGGEQEAPLPVASLLSTPLVKRKPLCLIKETKKDRKKIRLKLKTKYPPATDSAVPSSSRTGDLSLSDQHTHPPIEDGCVYVGSLKVEIIADLLRCPAEGCYKNFRNNTLLKMHIKHYHRELRKCLGATPKVIDLAHARTKPTEMEMRQLKLEAATRTIKVKLPRLPKKVHAPETKPEVKELLEPKLEPLTPVQIEGDIPPKIPRSLDSPKLRNVLTNKPKRPKVLLPVRKPEDTEINEELIKIEPKVEVPDMETLDFETAISTHTVTKPPESKKKKKFAACAKKMTSDDEEWLAMNSDVETRSSYPRSGTPDSKADQKLMSSESNEELKEANYTFTETGERIKIVHMKREEIINCHCGFREEDGLMVQCELCLCWQHALCHNIQKESDVPEKYTCSICLNPRRGRRSQRFLHDQDRLYEGLLPGAKPCESLRRSHELSGNLHRIEDALHALRVKYYVATKKDHPKLYLWAKDWETQELTMTQEKLNSDYSDLNIMISNIDKENLPVKCQQLDIRTPPPSEPETDRFSHKDNQLGSQALLSGLLSSPGGSSLDLPISTTELERLAKTVQAEAEALTVPPPVAVPVPEAAIENSACREQLLRHIQRCQALVDVRLDSIEAQVAELESLDPSFEDDETAEFFPRTKQTIQMLMRDLDTMEELGVIT